MFLKSENDTTNIFLVLFFFLFFFREESQPNLQWPRELNML